MIWLYLLLAIAALAVAFQSSSVTLSVIALLAGLGFIIAWVMGLLARRIGSQSRDEAMILDPQELRHLREQSEARRAAAGAGEPPAA